MRALYILLTLCLASPALAGVNINTATAAELVALPGIGPAKAGEIVAFRDSHGPFPTAESLTRVPGIGQSTLANLSDLITAGDGLTAAPAVVSNPEPPPDAVNINLASAEELDTLPGIGPHKAASILADRERNGAFRACADLTRVQGIGAATVASIGERCLVEPPQPQVPINASGPHPP